MKLKNIVSLLEKDYPLEFKEDWDNPGLLLGETNSEIKTIVLTLDITNDLIDYAIDKNADLIISHHPLIFNGIKQINNKTLLGKKILRLIKNDINVYTMHTNIDAACGGLNDYILEKLGVTESKIIVENYLDTYKLGVSVTEEKSEKLLKELNKRNSLKLKNDKDTYILEERYEIVGKSKVDDGKIGESLKSRFMKIEIMILKKDISSMVNCIKEFCLNEVVAYEIIKMENRKISSGIGRIYKISEMKISSYIEILKEKLNVKNLRAVYSEDKLVSKIAFVNGSGASFIKKVKNVDLFITGDIKYHEALDAQELGLNLIDIGHYEAEILFVDLVKEKLLDLDVDVLNFKGQELFKFI